MRTIRRAIIRSHSSYPAHSCDPCCVRSWLCAVDQPDHPASPDPGRGQTRLDTAVHDISTKLGAILRQVEWAADRNKGETRGRRVLDRDVGRCPGSPCDRRRSDAGPAAWRSTRLAAQADCRTDLSETVTLSGRYEPVHPRTHHVLQPALDRSGLRICSPALGDVVPPRHRARLLTGQARLTISTNSSSWIASMVFPLAVRGWPSSPRQASQLRYPACRGQIGLVA
jgi:hypothetical protein